MTSSDIDYDTEDEWTPEVEVDKKASLTKVASKPQPKKPSLADAPPPMTTPVSKKPEPFEAAERVAGDKPPDEKWETRRNREEAEKIEETKIVARMPEVRQLGVAAGKCAEDVKSLRLRLKHAEKSVVGLRQKVADAEALLNFRLDELRQVGL